MGIANAGRSKRPLQVLSVLRAAGGERRIRLASHSQLARRFSRIDRILP